MARNKRYGYYDDIEAENPKIQETEAYEPEILDGPCYPFTSCVGGVINSAAQCVNEATNWTIMAAKWTGCWVGALGANSVMAGLPGLTFGGLFGVYTGYYSPECIGGPNKYAVEKCATERVDKIGQAAVIGMLATGVVGPVLTFIGLFRDPTIKGAKATIEDTLKLAAIGCAAVGFLCAGNN